MSLSKEKNNISYLIPNADFSLGIGHGRYFSNNKWYLDFAVGYDFNYFWKQNFLRNFNDDQLSEDDIDAGDLLLHGLNISNQIDF